MHPNILHKQLIDPSQTSSPPSSPIPQPSSLPRQRWLTLATNAVDRAGDILVIAGMNAENFLKNPQFLWQHGASGAIINSIGRVLELKIAPETDGVKGKEQRVNNNAHSSTPYPLPSTLLALVEYAPADISPLAEQVYQMDMAGMLPANSIGFSPIEYEANEFGGYTFTEWELIECSKVELPMNPDAVDTNKSLLSDEEIEETIEHTLAWLLQ
jgi:hypothetical protein